MDTRKSQRCPIGTCIVCVCDDEDDDDDDDDEDENKANSLFFNDLYKLDLTNYKWTLLKLKYYNFNLSFLIY